MTAIAIVSPGYPGSPGGVTDHTARLVESWTGNGDTVHVFGDVSEPIASLAKRVEAEHIEALLIQYVPFLFGKRGISSFPKDLVDLLLRRLDVLSPGFGEVSGRGRGTVGIDVVDIFRVHVSVVHCINHATCSAFATL